MTDDRDRETGVTRPENASTEPQWATAGTRPIAEFETDVPARRKALRAPPEERLEVLGVLATGGMGVISVARDRVLGRNVAQKRLRPDLSRQEASVRLFLREAHITAVLDHPGIVPVYDLVERNGELFFTMKLVQGRTLKEMIRSLPAGPIERTTLLNLLDVYVRVCDALAFAHSRGVIHCDIKPTNIMCGDFGQVYLMDWGVARRNESAAQADELELSAFSQSGEVMGTPGYMAPEQALGLTSTLNERTDVFLVGAALYELFARRPPFRAASPDEVLDLARVARCVPLDKEVGREAVPSDLQRIVERCMQPDPGERYPDVSALRDALVHYIRGGDNFPKTFHPAGTTIVHEGEVGNSAYILERGLCEVRKTVDGQVTRIRTLGPGDVFGEMAVLTAGPRTASVVAIEDTTVLVVTGSALEQETGALKPWMGSLVRRLAERLRDTTRRVTGSPQKGPTPARIAAQLYLHLLAWGEPVGEQGRAGRWTAMSRALAEQLGASPVASMGFVCMQYPVVSVDWLADRVVVSDMEALRLRVDPHVATSKGPQE